LRKRGEDGEDGREIIGNARWIINKLLMKNKRID